MALGVQRTLEREESPDSLGARLAKWFGVRLLREGDDESSEITAIVCFFEVLDYGSLLRGVAGFVTWILSSSPTVNEAWCDVTVTWTRRIEATS